MIEAYPITGAAAEAAQAKAEARLLLAENGLLRAADRITELETALRAVHRHAITQYGIRTADQCSAALGYIDDICRAALAEEER